MPPKDRLAFYDALVDYALEGKEPENMPKVAGIAFVLCRPQIDANNRRYENGKRGGRPKKTDGFEFEKPMVLKSENLNETKPKPKEKEKEKEKVKENVYMKENANDSHELKEIYKKFFFMNFLYPAKEVKRYWAWGESTGWIKQSGRPITNRLSYAGFWKPENEGQRFKPIALKMLLLAYQRAWGEKKYSEAEAVFSITRESTVGSKTDYYGGKEASLITPYLTKVGEDLGLDVEIHAAL